MVVQKTGWPSQQRQVEGPVLQLCTCLFGYQVTLYYNTLWLFMLPDSREEILYETGSIWFTSSVLSPTPAATTAYRCFNPFWSEWWTRGGKPPATDRHILAFRYNWRNILNGLLLYERYGVVADGGGDGAMVLHWTHGHKMTLFGRK